MKFRHWYFLLLIAAISTLLLNFHSSMSKKLIIDSNSRHEMYVGTDQKTYNGTSQASVDISNGNIVLDCQLDDSSYSWPFCEMSFVLGIANQGVDLSTYETMRIKASIEGSVPKLRVYLISALNSGTAQLPEEFKKYHEVEYFPDQYGNDITLPLELFRPSKWWLQQYDKKLLDAVSELDNVIVA